MRIFQAATTIFTLQVSSGTGDTIRRSAVVEEGNLGEVLS